VAPMSRLLLALTSAFICAAAPMALQAASLRTWVDRDGVYHVEDAPNARASSRASASRTKARWWERRSDAPPAQIERAAAMYNIPAELIRAVIAAESAGDTSAISHRGAIGLMQLMPQTAGEMYVQDPVDPAQNILGGTRYLRWLANQFHGDMILTLAAYNAGPEAVRKYGGVPPFEETRTYVKKVIAYYQDLRARLSKAAGAKVAEAEK